MVFGSKNKAKPNGKGIKDLAPVRSVIETALDRDHELAPLLIRFAWHCCGTFDAKKKNGGSNGGTMRFEAESLDPENAGFAKANSLYRKIKAEHPTLLTFADLHILGGYVAIEWTGGPKIPFSYGRTDFSDQDACKIYGASQCPFGDGKFNPHGSRLPAADIGTSKRCSLQAPARLREEPTISAVRNTFARMGFNDRETVALILLGHQYGQCHPDVSGFEGPWYAFAPNHWNIYTHGMGYLSLYTAPELKYEEVITKAGKRQYETQIFGRTFMMLVSDMCLIWDPEYRKHVEDFDRNRLQFRREASDAWKKLTELGCEGILTAETT